MASRGRSVADLAAIVGGASLGDDAVEDDFQRAEPESPFRVGSTIGASDRIETAE